MNIFRLLSFFVNHDVSVFACQMIGASEEQLDVFNEMRYIMLLNTGRAKEGMQITLFLEYKFRPSYTKNLTCKWFCMSDN